MISFRMGQWVLLDNKQVGIFCGMDHGHHKVVGEVIVSQPTVRVANPQPNPTKCQIDIVDASGFVTTSHLLVDISRVSPVTKREQVPAARLKTCLPTWQPRP